MSKEALQRVVQRAISDAAFRRQLGSDPGAALRGFDLSADESAALRTGDAGRLSALGVDQRMSKAFTLAGPATVHRLGGTDLGASANAVTIGGTDLQSDALASGAARDSDALIPGGDRLGQVLVSDPAHAFGAVTSVDEEGRDYIPSDPSLQSSAHAVGGADRASDAFTTADEAGHDQVSGDVAAHPTTYSGDDLAGPTSTAFVGEEPAHDGSADNP